MKTQKQGKTYRMQIDFDEDMMKYYGRMARVRDEDLSPAVASVLREVMHDDMALEKAQPQKPRTKLFERIRADMETKGTA